MKLLLYREHLARELEQLPDFRVQAIQSYVLTTAILTRRIDDRLGGRLRSERVQPRNGRPLDFRQLVDLLIHYCRFDPSIHSTSYADSDVSAEEFYFRVYSQKARNKHDAGDFLSIRLADYFAIVEKIASDDVFVLRHLVVATITRLKRASSPAPIDPDDLSEVAASVDDIIWLSGQVIDSTYPSLRCIPLQAADVKFKHRGPGPMDLDEQLVDSNLYRTLGSLTDRYGTAWRYAPFMPQKIDGTEYCLLLEATDPNFGPVALPFSVLANALADMQNHLPTP